MEPIPIPSPIHYELVLQLLERQTMFAVSQKPELKDKVNQLIITLRKAAALQKQIEQTCEQAHIKTEYLWSLNHVIPSSAELPSTAKSNLNSASNGLKPPQEQS
ncbi:DUF5340 domain-containing protein [Planktothrix sp. FACHB-1355]|uniref:DUF5340 domain-containing protein n=1 Tax=Aerosakkonema funiforme FACHB-1375 TaxID=2949571 RepID=A0A926VGQ6_9CYAN|nr:MULTISPECIES: DUF5340 domain-containing protein [Oscillatoriales]MBD2183418.1 DUF5340 domain-containing protein [Aerosakkonema funiforme FACHB-1375]MBD3559234.1 DUF5340 domain-containing protein [Planktothrix sp. FACHB-1355]